jgi:hypothetical protein
MVKCVKKKKPKATKSSKNIATCLNMAYIEQTNNTIILKPIQCLTQRMILLNKANQSFSIVAYPKEIEITHVPNQISIKADIEKTTSLGCLRILENNQTSELITVSKQTKSTKRNYYYYYHHYYYFS